VVAGPWSDLRSQLSTFPVPAGFTTVDWAREGSSRCTDSGCVAQIRHTVQANVPAAAACPALEESLRTWPGTSAVTTDVPIGDWEKCAYFMSQRSDGTTREVEATVEAPPGRPAEIIVRMLADCVLTCPNQDSYGSDTS
jgi:hypothetical protein